MKRYSKEEIYQELMGNLAGTHKYMVKQLLSDNEEAAKTLEAMLQTFDCGPIEIETKEASQSDTGKMAQDIINYHFQSVLGQARITLQKLRGKS